MDQENKIIIITKKLKESREYQAEKEHHIWDQKTQQKTQKNHPEEVHIYDITTNKKFPKKHIFYVNDHVNKTGKNPLITQTKKPTFIDMSRTYIKKKNGVVTTCLGKYFNTKKNNTPYPSTEMCHVAIWYKSLKPTIKIKGFLINSS